MKQISRGEPSDTDGSFYPKGASRCDVCIGGGGGSRKSRRSKGGCVTFIVQISSKCEQWGRGLENSKILQCHIWTLPPDNNAAADIAATQKSHSLSLYLSPLFDALSSCSVFQLFLIFQSAIGRSSVGRLSSHGRNDFLKYIALLLLLHNREGREGGKREQSQQRAGWELGRR